VLELLAVVLLVVAALAPPDPLIWRTWAEHAARPPSVRIAAAVRLGMNAILTGARARNDEPWDDRALGDLPPRPGARLGAARTC
jgi:hypothetical protein